MKKKRIYFVCLSLLLTTISYGQIQAFTEPLVEVNKLGLEYGVQSGVNWRQKVELSLFYQQNIDREKPNYYGLNTYVVFAEDKKANIGMSCKLGLTDNEYFMPQPMVQMYYKVEKNMRLGFAGGMVNNWLSVQISIKYGVSDLNWAF